MRTVWSGRLVVVVTGVLVAASVLFGVCHS